MNAGGVDKACKSNENNHTEVVSKFEVAIRISSKLWKSDILVADEVGIYRNIPMGQE